MMEPIHLSLTLRFFPPCKFPWAVGIWKYFFNEARARLVSVNLAGIWAHKINTKSRKTFTKAYRGDDRRTLRMRNVVKVAYLNYQHVCRRLRDRGGRPRHMFGPLR